MSLWRGIIKFYTAKGYSFGKAVYLSDVGSAELKFVKEINIEQHFYCWFHVSELFKKYNKSFKISMELGISIRRYILRIYCSKTKKYRGELVIKFINYLEKINKDLLKKYLVYLEIKVLDKWTCCLKISTLRDHSTNYLEREFKESNRFSRNMCQISKVIENNHVILKNKIIDAKMKNVNCKVMLIVDIIEKGRFHFELYKIKIVGDIFLVQSSQKKSHYQVDLRNFYCTCPSFNGEYTQGAVLKKKKKRYGSAYGKFCKHMACAIWHLLVEKEKMSVDEVKEMDPFDFIKFGRCLVCKNKSFKEFIINQTFPVTISEIEWLDQLKTK